MAITHSAFLTQIRNYTEVDANVLTDAIIQDFIRSVELGVAGKVDYDDLRKYATSNFTSSNRYITLPSDAMIVRSIQVIDGSGNRTFLEKRDTSFISEYNNDGSTGTPKYWANWDDFTALVAPTPSSALQVQINYIIDPPKFTSTNNTFLSTYQESMLLHGVLAEAYRFLKGPMDMYNLYETEYNEEIQNFALQQMGRRRRSEYDDGVPRVQVPSPTPNT
jgi:hypothetical protein